MAPRDAHPPLVLAAAWPGWSGAGTVVVPIDAAAWPPPARAINHDGRAFAPKHELHVTVIGRALGARLQAAIAAGRLPDTQLAETFAAAGPWRLRRTGWRIALRKSVPGEPDVESIIEPVALPAMGRFYRRLGAAIDELLPVPPPHVTLHVAGNAEGIGLADAATLARLRQGPAWRAED
jgi:hypothetical protein